MAFGTAAYLRIARQNSAGVAVTAAGSFIPVPFVSETLVTEVPELISDTIRGRYEQGPSAKGIVSGMGDMVIRPAGDLIGLFAYAFTGAATSTVVVSGLGWQHNFIPTETQFHSDIAITPFTIGKYVGVGNEFQYTDSLLNRLTLEIVAGQYMRGTANWMCRVSSLTAATSVTMVEATEYVWSQASLSLGGAANVNWEQVTITMDNALQQFATLDGTTSNRRVLRTNFRTFQLTATADVPDLSEFNTFRAGSLSTLDITTQGVTVSSGVIESFRIIVPQFRYATYPVAVGGPNRVTVGLSGRFVWHSGSAAAVQILVVNSRNGY